MNRLNSLLEKASVGKRLNFNEAVEILREADLISLGRAADTVRRRLHPENEVTFIVDRNINYTNICACKCYFCAFYRGEESTDAYVLSKDELLFKIKELVAIGGTEVLIQGGLHPKLNLGFYLDMLRSIKEHFDVHIHSFSPPEIVHIAAGSGLTVKEVLERLMEAGLDTLPGGGAEILDDRVRKIISPNKISASQWLNVMREAHNIGMKTTATMMFGHIESLEERVGHLFRVRELQDSTNGFTAFIPWTYQPRNTKLEIKPATGVDYLRLLAVARLVLDNVPNIQASWVTQGPKMAQVALSFGANDFGSTMLEENVVRAAGVTNRISINEIVRCIKDAGFKPARRDTLYNIIYRY